MIWALKFETMTESLTYLLTRLKSRDASASKKLVGFGTGCDEYKILIQTNIRIYLYPKNDTNEYLNIFVSKR